VKDIEEFAIWSFVGACVCSVVVFACGSRGPITHRTDMRERCYPESAERRAEFIIKCSEAANPKSDEEGEDLVAECRRTSERLFCPEEKFVQIADYQWLPCSEAKEPFVGSCK
jgi:hypothetical protein